jgi:hypothetical protein
VEKSPDLQTWTPLTGFTQTFDPATGRMVLDFAPDAANAYFYRILGAKP